MVRPDPRVNAELMFGATYVLEPQVREDARLRTMEYGTLVVKRSPLALAQDNSRPSRQGRNSRSGSPTFVSAADLLFAPIPVTVTA